MKSIKTFLGELKFKVLMHLDMTHTFTKQNYQNSESFILMEAHRLEKSMCLSNQDKSRGYDRALDLLRYINSVYVSNNGKNRTFAIKVGISVINAFIENKKVIDPASDKLVELSKLVSNSKAQHLIDDKYGGVINITKPDESLHNYALELFNSRHSCRSFESSSVDISKVEQAISMALQAPSACNRQPCKCYLISDEKISSTRQSTKNDYNAQFHLIITADCTAYSKYEFNDWIVSSSIFVGYLSLSLHSLGIGACIMRKPLYESDEYIRLLRNLCNIPKNEKITIELLVGNYPDSFIAPISKRKSSKEVLVIID